MQQQNLIGRGFCDADDGATIPVRDPATGAEVARVPACGAAEAGRAIDAAAEAFPEWAGLPAAARAGVLRRFADGLSSEHRKLAKLITLEGGKPRAEAEAEVAYAASFLAWASGEAERVYGETVPSSRRNQRIVVLRQPVGVTAAITPWNFPAAMITRKLGPALAAGCTMVVKPAEQTPLTALALAELALAAGVPAGVVQVVTGPPASIAEALLGDARVRKLSFTGSTEVGRLLMAGAAQHVTRLSLELGGHAPFLVFDDADLDAAVAGAMASKFRNAGQTCICPNRFFVQDGIYSAFVERLSASVAALQVGRGSDDAVDVGPLIDAAALEKVQAHVQDALEGGASASVGGARCEVADAPGGHFFAPTVLQEVKPGMRICHEETFGPVVPLQRFATEAEAIARANDTPFGLAAYFYTRDAARVWRVAEGLEYGIVGANDAAVSTAQAPFGGVKASGFGREGGHYAMHDYLAYKYVSWGL